MGAFLSSLQLRRPTFARTGGGSSGRDLFIAGAVVLTAMAAGYQLAHGNEPAAAALCLLPLVVLGVSRPAALLVPLAAVLPFTQALPGIPGGYQVSPSDLLLGLIFVGILLQGLPAGAYPSIAALRPVAPPVILYSVIMMVLLVPHWSIVGLAQTIQRYELFLFPLVVGAFAVLSGRYVPMLQVYVVGATALAVIWPLHQVVGQKNPVGQMIGNAILVLLIDHPAIRRLFPCLLVLVPGLLLTQSRGAVLATVLGALVIMLMQGISVRTIFKRALPFILVGVVAFALAPAPTQARLLTFSASQETSAGYAVYLRQTYIDEAKEIFWANQWTGVGIGNYSDAGRALGLSGISDPHMLLLLQAAEGGVILAAGFVLLAVWSLARLWKLRRVALVPVAAGVLVATVAHGLLDVYWVRGTPVLSWLLIGMACAAVAHGVRTDEGRS